jgi:hypothetical protein
MLDHLGRDFLRAIRHALGRVLQGWLIGLLAGALFAEAAGFFVEGDWPRRPFVHVAAIALAVTLSYAIAVTVAMVEGVRGMMAAATQLDDVAKVAANAGLGVIDAAVDAVDGPNRHGIR